MKQRQNPHLPMASLQTLFLLSTVSQAPSLIPRMSNKVSYLHEEGWQPQAHAQARLHDPPRNIYIDLKFAFLDINAGLLLLTSNITLSLHSVTNVFQSNTFKIQACILNFCTD